LPLGDDGGYETAYDLDGSRVTAGQSDNIKYLRLVSRLLCEFLTNQADIRACDPPLKLLAGVPLVYEESRNRVAYLAPVHCKKVGNKSELEQMLTD